MVSEGRDDLFHYPSFSSYESPEGCEKNVVLGGGT